MPGMLKKAANWLGLIDDERYGYPVGDADEFSQGVYPEADEEDDAEDSIEVVRRDDDQAGRASRTGPAYPLVIPAYSYDDAEQIGDAFRSGVPVVANLTAMAVPEAKRVLDFNAGMVYALGGRVEKLAPKVFLLSPDGVRVSPAERERVLAGLARPA